MPLEFGDGDYLLQLPLGMLCQNAGQNDQGDVALAGLVMIDIDGEQCLPLFTDDDLAIRYMQDNGVTAKIAWLNGPIAIAELLEQLRDDEGYRSVAIDPSKQKGRPVPINDVIATLRTEPV